MLAAAINTSKTKTLCVGFQKTQLSELVILSFTKQLNDASAAFWSYDFLLCDKGLNEGTSKGLVNLLYFSRKKLW